MKKMFSLSALLLGCFFVCLAANTGLNGEWTGKLKTDDGNEYPLVYHFTVNGDKLTGTVKGPHGDLPLIDGEVHGDDFTFDVTLEKMHILHSGTFYPDSVSLDLESGDAKAHTTLLRGDR
jgi:hypothetical protein